MAAWHGRARAALAGACLALALLPFSHTDRQLIDSDWTAFATGARLAAGTHPELLYDRPAQQRAQDDITGGGSFALKGQGRLLPFLSPPWVALLAVPFAGLGLGWGGRLFTLVEVLGLLLGVALARPGDRWAPLAVVASFPALVMVLNAQLDGLLVLGLGLAVAAHRAGRHVPAGLALGLTLVKPHLVVPLACALLLGRRWREAAGWGLAAAGLVALTSLREPDWMLGWLHAVGATVGRNGREIDPGTWAWSLGLPARVATLVTLAIALTFLGAVLGAAARRWRSGPNALERTLAAVVAGGVLVAPHALPSDLTLVAFAMALVGGTRAWEWALLSLAAEVAALAGDPWPPLVCSVLVAGLIGRLGQQLADAGKAARADIYS